MAEDALQHLLNVREQEVQRAQQALFAAQNEHAALRRAWRTRLVSEQRDERAAQDARVATARARSVRELRWAESLRTDLNGRLQEQAAAQRRLAEQVRLARLQVRACDDALRKAELARKAIERRLERQAREVSRRTERRSEEETEDAFRRPREP